MTAEVGVLAVLTSFLAGVEDVLAGFADVCLVL